jgi:biotin transport system substrate-specific component
MASEQTDAVDLIEGDVVTKLSGAVLIAALTGVLAQFSIPLPGGVPFSLQPFAVFFAGLLLGPIWGGFAMALYVLVGVAGAPVFSNAAAGIGVVFGPTGGFLLSYPIASFAIGYLAHQSLSASPVEELTTVPVTAGLLVGQVPIYALGTVWFASQQGLAIAEGAAIMWPFLAGDLIKVAITVAIIRGGAEVLYGRL